MRLKQSAGRNPHKAFEDRRGRAVIVTYLQMFAHPQRVIPPPRDGLEVVHAKKPTIAYYRFLYDAVGRDYAWDSRKKLTDADLAAIIHDPGMKFTF